MKKSIETLFAEAVSLSGVDRVRFLERLVESDSAMAREIESLLSHADVAAGRLGRLVEQAVTFEGPLLAPGDSLGSYRVVRHIANGGMGSVYEAARDGDFQKRVAVKLSRFRDDCPERADSLRRERQILAGLEHPNIGGLLDGGTAEDGRPYLVMEYVDGPPITDWVKSRRLSQRQCIELFRKVCAGVAYAHEHLVVHRDLKPENILVTQGGEPKVLDFGIAKMLPAEGASASRRTTLLFLSLAYCSPEQARAEPVTTRSDVYSLGIILYELLTGKEARVLEHLSPSEMKLVAAHSGELSANDLDPDLEMIIRMATRLEPRQRYGSARALSEDLGRFLDGRPIEARAATRFYYMQKFVARHRALVTICLVSVLMLVAGAAGFAWQAQRAERRFALARKLANSLLTDIHDKVNAVPGAVELRAQVSGTAIEYLDALSKEAGSDARLRIELAAGYARLAASQGGVASQLTVDKAIESANRGLALLRGMPPDYHERLRATEAELRLQRGQALSDTDRLQEAITDLQSAVEFTRCRAGAQDECLRELAARYHLIYHFSSTRKYQHAQENLEQMRLILARHGDSWPRHKMLWELYAAAREMRLIVQRDRDHAKAARVGDGWLPMAAAVAASEANSGLALNALMRFYNYYSSALANDRSASFSRKAPAAREFHRIARILADADPGDVRARVQVAIASDRLGWAYHKDDPVQSATWFEKSIDSFISARNSSSVSSGRDGALLETAEEGIRTWLRANRPASALDLALRVSRVVDPAGSSGLKLPRSAHVQQVQGYAFAAATAIQQKSRFAPELWRQAKDVSDRAIQLAPTDPMLLAASASLAKQHPSNVGVQKRLADRQ